MEEHNKKNSECITQNTHYYTYYFIGPTLLQKQLQFFISHLRKYS